MEHFEDFACVPFDVFLLFKPLLMAPLMQVYFIESLVLEDQSLIAFYSPRLFYNFKISN